MWPIFSTGNTTNIWDVRELPQGLNNVLFNGTNLLGSEIILTVFLTVLIIMPFVMMKAKSDVLVTVVILAILVNTALGWLNLFLGTMMCVMIAVLYAGAFRKMIVGG